MRRTTYRSNFFKKYKAEEVYAFFVGPDLTQRYISPLRMGEKTPSLSFYERDGDLLWHDLGKTTHPKGGDAMAFVYAYYKYNQDVQSLPKALARFDKDFRDGRFFDQPHFRKAKSYIPEYSTNYTDYELAYWAKLGVSQDLLEREHVYRLESLTREDGTITKRSSPKRPCFYYHFGKGWKTYSPFAPKEYKFQSSNLLGVLEGELSIRKADVGIISSSTKDRLTLKALGYEGINPTGENSLKTLINRKGEINKFYSKIYVIFDGDETGINSASQLELETGWIALYLDYPEGTKDVSDIVWNYSQDKLIEILQQCSYTKK